MIKIAERNTKALSIKSDMTLNISAIKKDTDKTLFWNKQCQDLQSWFWLPKDGNYIKAKTGTWQETCQAKSSTSIPLQIFLSKKDTPHLKPGQMTGVRKIRVYPKDEKAFKNILTTSRRAYNLAIEIFKKSKDKIDFKAMFQQIRKQVTDEVVSSKQLISRSAINQAIREAQFTRNAVIQKRMKKQKADFHFKSRKFQRQTFIIEKLAKSGIYPRILGDIYVTEDIPEEAFGHQAKVTYEYGRWFLCARMFMAFGATENQGAICAIDPGVRNFLTIYSQDQVTTFGKDFAKDKLAHFAGRIDSLISKRRKLLNTKDTTSERLYYQQYLRHYNHKINRLRAKMADMINDLHKKSAFWLVNNFDIILLPTFEVTGMTKKGKGRKIRKKTVRSMLSLNHFKFKLMLKHMAKKYGKVVIDVNEAYTSKTLSWSGEVIDVGSDKVIKRDGITVDRDHNGARNILVRALTRTGATPGLVGNIPLKHNQGHLGSLGVLNQVSLGVLNNLSLLGNRFKTEFNKNNHVKVLKNLLVLDK